MPTTVTKALAEASHYVDVPYSSALVQLKDFTCK